jgi:hypothetical protein
MATSVDSAPQRVAVFAETGDRRAGADGQPGPRRTDRDVDSHRRLSVLIATTLVGVRLMAIAIPSTEPPKLSAGPVSPRAVRQTLSAARTGMST